MSMTRERELEILVDVTMSNLKNQIRQHEVERILADENIKRCKILYNDLEAKLNQIDKVYPKVQS